MTRNSSGPSDETLAALLAAYHDALARGASREGALALLRRRNPAWVAHLEKLEAFFGSIEQAFNGGPPPHAITTVSEATGPYTPAVSSAAGPPPSRNAQEPRQPVPVVRGYEILGVLGKGGMGIVYKARQVKADRIVALKMILIGGQAAPHDLARFQTESESIASLQHPHIVQVYEVGDYEGLPFFSLEYCPGGSLKQKLGGTPLPPRDGATLVAQLARAIQAIHKRGIIHRDLKPANVLLGEGGFWKVADFGLAKKLAEVSETMTGAVIGTPSYMAPEQAAGRIHDLGPRTDVYGLGAILYEVLTGRPPFNSPSLVETLEQVRFQEPVLPRRLQPTVPRDLEMVCLKCLEKEPTKRYGSAGALADDLERFSNDEPILARPPALIARFWLWCRRPMRIQQAGAFMMFLGVVFILWNLIGLILVGSGIHHVRDPAGAIITQIGTTVICLPMVGIGVGSMARRRLWLWVGAVTATGYFALVIIGIVGPSFSITMLNVGGQYDQSDARYPVFTLLFLLLGVQFFNYIVALVAYHSNPNSVR